jgi:hypothetical protein
MDFQRSRSRIATGNVILVGIGAILLVPFRALGEEQQKSPANASKVDARREVDEIVEELRGALRKAATGQTITDDVRRCIADLRRAGGKDASVVLREIYDDDATWTQERVIILRALQELGTAEALTALKQIAGKPGKGARTLAPRAVQAVAALAKDADEISELLASDVPEVRNAAVSALRDKELTDVSVKRLGDLIRSDSWITHNLLSSAFLTDRSTATVARKVDTVLAALPQLKHLKDAEKVDRQTGFTASESALGIYVRGLALMKGTEPVLRERLGTLVSGGLEHKAVVLALALRGDTNTRALVLPIARQDTDGFWRLLAVEGLGAIGTPEDTPLLERIAKTDMYMRPSTSDRTGEAGRMIYPVRAAAQRAIVAIGKRLAPEKAKK